MITPFPFHMEQAVYLRKQIQIFYKICTIFVRQSYFSVNIFLPPVDKRGDEKRNNSYKELPVVHRPHPLNVGTSSAAKP